MKVRLGQIREKPFRWEESVEMEAETLGNPDVGELGPIRWGGEIEFVDPGFLLSAHYAYEQKLPCFRCLRPVSDGVEGDLQLLLLPGEEEVEEGEHLLQEEELGVVHVDEEEDLELDELLRDQIELNVPMKPLCKPECKGLCPQCGADLNEGPCNCDGEPVDPRWAGLAALKERLEDER